MNEYYETRDICLAAVLQCLRNPVIAVEWQEDGRATFFFDDAASCHKIVEEFWLFHLKVEPRTFFNSLKAVKARLYDKNEHVWQKHE